MKKKLIVLLFVAAAVLVATWVFLESTGRLQLFEPGLGNRAAATRTLAGGEDRSERAGSGEAIASRATQGERPMSFVDIKSRAESGSAEHQRRLAEVYEDCGAISIDRSRYMANLDYLAELNPDSKSQIQRIKRSITDQCAAVDRGEPIPADAARLWLAQAAKGGDLVAELKLQVYKPAGVEPAQMSQLVAETLQSDNAEAMLALSNIARHACLQETRANPICGSPAAEWAWAIAACRRGASCGPESRLMTQLCISTGRCNYPSYENFLANEVVPPAQRRNVDQTIERIARSR